MGHRRLVEAPSVGELPAEHDLQRAGLTGAGEDVVGLHELAQREVVRDETGRLDLVRGHEAEQGRGRVGVNQPGGDGDVLDPQILEVEGRRLAVNADVRDPPAGAYQPRA